MKEKLIIMIFMILSVLSFNNCSIDNSNDYYVYPPTYGWYWQPYQTNSNGQYGIGGYVSGAPTTRAYTIQQSDVIGNYDSFSLFMWTKDSVLNNGMFDGILNPQQGTWGYEGNQRFFDNNQPRYSFLGILPKDDYNIKADSTVDVSLEDFVTEGVDINAQKYNKEFIVAKTTVEKANYAQGATLNFEHQNSIVRIKFETDNTNNLEILDFTPYTPGSPEVPATPGTPTEKTSKMFDELVAGNTVGWPYMVGTESSIYSGSAGTYMNYQGSNLSTARISNTRLAELMPLVNAQFIYTDTNGNNVSNTAWTKGEKKNTVFLKFTDNVDTDEFLAGNDAFWTNLTAEEKTSMQNWYNSGIRVARIDQLSDGNYFCWGMLNNQMTVTVVSGGTPYQPAVAATGKEGIVVLPATSVNQNGKDAVLSTFPETVTANIGLNGVTYTINTTEQEIIFTKPGTIAYSVYSPTNWYTFPVTHVNDFGFTIKFSYTLNGVTRYDARVFVPAAKCNWQPGKWYDYIIKVNSTKSGKTNPEDADEDDPKIDEEFPINVNSSVDEYTEGEVHEFTI